MTPKKILISTVLLLSVVFASFLILDDEAKAETTATGKLTVPTVSEVMVGKGKKAPDFMWTQDGKDDFF
jgi:hypothetical protein